MGVIDDLIPDIDSILGIRDDLGVALKKVYLVTRTWSGSEIGAGEKTETKKRMLPSPRVTEYKKDLRIREGGGTESADVELRMISKASYKEADLNFKDAPANVEMLYLLDGEYYRPIRVRERHVCWNVLLRRVSNQ